MSHERIHVAAPPTTTAAAGRRVSLLAVHHVFDNGHCCTGGAEKYIRMCADALLECGAAVHVGYSGASIYADLLEQHPPNRLTVERTRWVDASLAGDSRLDPRVIARRRRWLHATGADTVFIVQQASGAAFAASIVAARSLGLRVVMSIRQPVNPLPGATGKRWLGLIPSPELWRRRLLWRRTIPARCCDVIIYNSRRIADQYAREMHYPADRARVIYNGEHIPPAGTPRAVPPRRIATVGRVTRAKGPDTLLEAFARIAAEHPAAQLTYFGDGPLIGALRERAASLGLAARVHFAGYISDHDALYRNVDLYVQASRREAMSNSVIEAMARGIPCVVSDVGGLPETVLHEQTGLITPAADVSACAAAVDRLMCDTALYQSCSQAAQQRIATVFRLDRIRAETVSAILGMSVDALPHSASVIATSPPAEAERTGRARAQRL